MTLGEALEANLGEKPTKTELAAVARQWAKKKSRGVNPAQEAELLPVPEPLVVPAMAPKWSAETIKNFLGQFTGHGVVPLQSFQRDPQDPHFKKSLGLQNLMTHHQTYTTVSKDVEMFVALAQLPHTKFEAGAINRVRSALQEANKVIMTNGPSSGLYERMKAGLTRPKPAFRFRDYIPYVLKHFPIDKSKLPKLAGLGARDLTFVRMDLKTGYGSPFMRPKVSPEGNYLAPMVTMAGKILECIASGTIDQWTNQNPALCVALLKNKLDKYQLDEVATKIRPYYTYPAHWNLLFSALWQGISGSAASFLEDPTSINAHGFSWARGGANKLIAWIEGCKTPGVYVAAYSDDQLWVIVTADGKKYIVLPDYKMMDMSLGTGFGQLAHAWLIQVYGDYLDNTWAAVARMNCRMAFEKFVLVSHALTYLIKGGLGSGVPGTAEFDQIASCAAMRFIEPALRGLKSGEEIPGALGELAKSLKAHLGLEIKPETMAVHEFESGGDYPWLVFLGHAVRKHVVGGETHYVPVRPFDKIVLSYVQPAGTYGKDSRARIRGLMERLIGVTASGGWFHPELYYAAKWRYEAYLKDGYFPAPENDMAYADYERRPATIETPPWAGTEFPPVEWFQSIVLGWQVVAQATETARQVPLSSVWEVSKDWADDEGDHTPYDMDKGGSVGVPQTLPTSVAKQGLTPPLTQAQKDAYHKYLRVLRAQIRASYQRGALVFAPKGKRATGTKMAAWMEEVAPEWEREAQDSLGDDVAEEEYDAESIPDEVLDEMHERRFDAEDVQDAYLASTRARAAQRGREVDDLPPWAFAYEEGRDQ